jgi:hypothetical protein
MKENFHMQSWAKRGLQTALVTGGLLMLGTGIASADENIDPDIPASLLDLNVTVPYTIADNALGTPVGQIDLGGATGEISTKPVTRAVKGALASVKNPAGTAISPGVTPAGDAVKGNKVSGDVVVPIQITCNAIGVVGDASVSDCSSSQSYSHNHDVATSGKNSGIAGNGLVLDWAAPIQIAGNAGGLAGGSGYASGSASQSTSETGNTTTTGEGSALSGNVVAGQFATPVQVTGNAASWILGNAYSEYDADTSATSGGWIQTNGDGGTGTGSVVGAPIALPIKFNCNAGGVWGSDADTGTCNTSADAQAGNTTPGGHDTQSYIQTGGDKSFLGGNIIAPQGGLIANVAGIAGSWIGNSSTNGGSSSSTVDSGGSVSTDATQSAGSGNIFDPAVALPVEAFGIGGTYIGNSHASHHNTTNANAGYGSYTNGNDAFAGGNIVNTQDAATAEVFGIGGSHIGNATGQATEEKTVTAGGYNGTLGNNSSGSGNLVQVPVSVPAEMFGMGGSFIGQGSGYADEIKVLHGGGGGNTEDDNAVVSSNLAAVPLSVPVQFFGIGGSIIGQGHGKASSDTTSSAGGDTHATGPFGAIAGNLMQTPVSLPVQGHGVGGSVIGIGTGASDNLTDSTAGGSASTNGHGGAGTGNIVQAPVAGSGTVFGDGAVLGGLGHGTGTNDVVSTAGGDSSTNGDQGSVAGNIIGADALPIAQVFGDAASVLPGVGSGTATNTTSATSGGDVTTSGAEGSLSGDILDVPTAAVAPVFGNAMSVGGIAHAIGANQATGTAGGDATSAGDEASLSGFTMQQPVGALVPVYTVALELFGGASAEATDATAVQPQVLINLPVTMSELRATDLPKLPSVDGGQPTTLPADVSGLPALPGLPTLPFLPTLPGARQNATPEAQVPAMAQLEGGPLSMFSSLVADLAGKKYHIQ